MLVEVLHDNADRQRQAQVVASELEQDAAELRVAEDGLMAGGQLVEARTEISDELADLYATTTGLQEFSDRAFVSTIERDLRTLDSALRSQLAYVEAGRLETAEEVAEQQTEPAFDAVDARVDATNDYFEIAAERSSRVNDMGLWVALLIAGVAIGGLSWRHEQARRASQMALKQRLAIHLNQRNVDAARAVLKEARERNPDERIRLTILEADLLTELQRYTEARTLLTEAI